MTDPKETTKPIEGVKLTSDGSLVGLGYELLQDRTGDGYSSNSLRELGPITVTNDQIASLQQPSCRL